MTAQLKSVSARALRTSACLALLMPAWVAAPVFADSFSTVRYDPNTDEIVAHMIYRGTNSHHRFSVQWGSCVDREGTPGKAIEAQVIDDQWDDAAVHSYRSTARFSLMDLHCRPAKVTLRTAPRFYYTIVVPAGTTDPHYVSAPQNERCAPGYQKRGASICVPALPRECDGHDVSGGGPSSDLARRCK
jgi:hypothetical protein